MRSLLPVAAAIALTLVFGSADAWAHTGATAPGSQPADNMSSGSARRPSAGATSVPVSPSLDQSYAAREATAKSLEAFQGGDIVIIGSSTAIVVLLIIIILIVL